MKTFYRKEMSVEGNQSFSPSAGKPAALIQFLKERGHELSINEEWKPLRREDFYLAHSKEMVDSILDGKSSNGFGNKSMEVARTLAYTSGSLFAASKDVLINGGVNFSPTSGFHHACFNSPGGFCTFNGLMITALKLKEMGLVKRLGIVDLDAHYGDGTDHIISELNLDFITHYTFGAHGIGKSNAKVWVDTLPGVLKDFDKCDLILYQAGADPHERDPLGGSLSTKIMEERDKVVFEHFYKSGTPLVWNLAGGYQDPLEKVLELHETTFRLGMESSRRFGMEA